MTSLPGIASCVIAIPAKVQTCLQSSRSSKSSRFPGIPCQISIANEHLCAPRKPWILLGTIRSPVRGVTKLVGRCVLCSALHMSRL